MKLKETLLSLALVASVFCGLFFLTEYRATSQSPSAFAQGDFIVVPLNGQPTAIQKPSKPNAQPVATPATPLDHRWQSPAADEDDSDNPDSVGSRILGPFSVAMLLLGLSLWALYEVGRKKREKEQKAKRNTNGK
jgi:hypothetical protein